MTAAQVTAQIEAFAARENLFASALDLLADGIALLRRDGGIVYVNEALRMLAARGSDFRIARNTIEFSSADTRGRFAAALGAARPGTGDGVPASRFRGAAGQRSAALHRVGAPTAARRTANGASECGGHAAGS